jgi:hypothetical protein
MFSPLNLGPQAECDLTSDDDGHPGDRCMRLPGAVAIGSARCDFFVLRVFVLEVMGRQSGNKAAVGLRLPPSSRGSPEHLPDQPGNGFLPRAKVLTGVYGNGRSTGRRRTSLGQTARPGSIRHRGVGRRPHTACFAGQGRSAAISPRAPHSGCLLLQFWLPCSARF